MLLFGSWCEVMQIRDPLPRKEIRNVQMQTRQLNSCRTVLAQNNKMWVTKKKGGNSLQENQGGREREHSKPGNTQLLFFASHRLSRSSSLLNGCLYPDFYISQAWYSISSVSDTDVLFLYNYMPSLWVVKNDWGWFLFRATRKAHLSIPYVSSIALKMCF